MVLTLGSLFGPINSSQVIFIWLYLLLMVNFILLFYFNFIHYFDALNWILEYSILYELIVTEIADFVYCFY